MKNLTVVMGSQWGDEGKGKIVDYLSPKYDLCVRFNGGNNAGHTVVVNGEAFKLSLIPSGVLYNKTLCLAQGVVIDPLVLINEIEFFEKKLNRKVKLMIDPRAHIVMPYHKDWDAATEHWRGEGKVGSLHLGIGYTYSDRTNRFGVRFEDLIDSKRLAESLNNNYSIKKEIITKAYKWKMNSKENEIYKEYLEYGKKLLPYLGDVSEFVADKNDKDKKILFEGSQGTFLDMAFGTYPFTVACPTISSAVFPSVGLPAQEIEVVGLVKAYTTRVGGGPFKTELLNKTGEKIREVGREFGTVSKRPRRIGWLDLPMIRYAHRINGYSNLAITKLDVLSGIKTLKICTHYLLGTKRLKVFPSLQKDFVKVKPIYKEFEGWDEDIRQMENYKDLPKNCKKYLDFIESSLNVPIKYISVSPERKAVILK